MRGRLHGACVEALRSDRRGHAAGAQLALVAHRPRDARAVNAGGMVVVAPLRGTRGASVISAVSLDAPRAERHTIA